MATALSEIARGAITEGLTALIAFGADHDALVLKVTVSGGKLPDDGVIDPRDTRTVLGLCLSAVHSAAVEGAEHVGMFRP